MTYVADWRRAEYGKDGLIAQHALLAVWLRLLRLLLLLRPPLRLLPLSDGVRTRMQQ